MEEPFLDSITYFETTIQRELDRATEDTPYEVTEENTYDEPVYAEDAA